eukprot:1160556-Pelagomonas_calceolata.AAC.1
MQAPFMTSNAYPSSLTSPCWTPEQAGGGKQQWTLPVTHLAGHRAKDAHIINGRTCRDVEPGMRMKSMPAVASFRAMLSTALQDNKVQVELLMHIHEMDMYQCLL